MRTLAVLVALSAATFAFGSFACGGNDKPPLTPDAVESPADAAEAGAPTPPSSAAPTPSAPKN